ncbi:glycosyltransferase family 2 protein [Gymnodinialimonas sp. 57CJ19]|uniref:glycosyltransferase family 2 protein n=1 Tax=Gymnodinialimonas sp. 57CJ19 TaxID=3138498 RepID=UPI0031346369
MAKRVTARKKAGARLLFMTIDAEAPFIVEWVAYHRELGFDRIVVFAYVDDVNTTALLKALAAKKVIELHLQGPEPGSSIQASAINLANDATMLKDVEWAMWLDGDEFLVVSTGDGTLKALLETLADRDGMLIPRRMMGDGGNDRFPGRFVSEQFTDAAAAEDDSNLQMKTLFRCTKHIEGFSRFGYHRPKIREGVDPAELNFVMASGNGIDMRHRPHRRWLRGEEFNRIDKMQPDEHGYALAQINSYALRTPEIFALERFAGQDIAQALADGDTQQNTVEAYRDQNHVATQDRRILRLEAATGTEMDRIRALTGVAKAEALVHEDLASRVADIPASFLDACIATRPARAEPRTFPLTLPDEEAALVRKEYAKADTILEYGSGGSSFVALESGDKTLFTVESDRSWALTIHDTLQAAHPHANFTVQYVDVGPTKAWGKPSNAQGYGRYSRYPSSVWDLVQFQQPDVVLVDGRFRVACFLTTLFRTKKPVTLLFDDYTGRINYHWIEKYVKPSQTAGRMARFEIKPTALPADDLTEITAAYANPE